MSACIGHHNQRYFFMFMLACFRGMIICDTHLWYIWKTYSDVCLALNIPVS